MADRASTSSSLARRTTIASLRTSNNILSSTTNVSPPDSEDEDTHTHDTGSEDVEMLPVPEKISPQPRQRLVRISRGRVVLQMVAFYFLAMAFMATHLAFFVLLDGQPVETSGFGQNLQAALANFLAIAVEICFLSGISVAYDQILWRLFRRKELRAYTIDKLVTLATSPWNLVRPHIVAGAPQLWLIAFLCFLVPVTVVFPPGALTVEFQDAVLPVSLTSVPTLNLSDWGNGTARDFVRHALMESDNDFVYMNEVRPSLRQTAALVLGLGEPIHFPTPCRGPCNYTLTFNGPKFRCSQPKPAARVIGSFNSPNSTRQCTGNIFEAEDGVTFKHPWIFNNTFALSWDTIKNGHCDPGGRKSMACSMLLATYNISISNSQDGLRTIQTRALNESTAWTDTDPVQSAFGDYFVDYKNSKFHEPPINQDDLSRKFTRAQAFSIRKAAVDAIAGRLFLFTDKKLGVELPWVIPGSGSLAAGSPYIGLGDKFNPSLDINPEAIERYLQDVVVSVISLNQMDTGPLWTNADPVTAFAGANVYRFSEPWQFYGPYVSCLFVTLIIYILGYRALYRNGSSASNSFLQFAATTSTSNTLREIATECSIGGAENLSRELRDVKLRFGLKKIAENPNTSASSVGTAVLGAVDEVEPFHA